MIAPARNPEPKVPRLESQAERDTIFVAFMGNDDHATAEQRKTASLVVQSIRADYYVDERRKQVATALIALQSRGEPLSQSLLISELRGKREAIDALNDAMANHYSDAFVSWQHNLKLLREAYAHNSGTQAPPPARTNGLELALINSVGTVGTLQLKPGKTKGKPRARIVPMAQIEHVQLQYLWPGKFPMAKATQLAGNGGVGKSFLTMDIATRVSRGSVWPDGSGFAPLGSTLILNSEDGAGDTIRPRLDAMGADIDRIHYLESIQTEGAHDRAFSLRHDVELLEEAALELGDLKLIIIDPISSYLSGTDANNSGEVRTALDPLKGLAERTGAAVLLVNHLNKGSGAALYRACGSIAITSMVRTSWAVVKDRDDPQRRLVLPTKSNIGPDDHGMAYRIIAGRLEWETGPVTMSADEALEHKPGAGGEQRATGKAEAWLREYLASGCQESDALFNEAQRHGHARRTLFRIKDKLGIKPYKQLGVRNGPWFWELPAEPSTEECQIPKDANLEIDWHTSNTTTIQGEF